MRYGDKPLKKQAAAFASICLLFSSCSGGGSGGDEGDGGDRSPRGDVVGEVTDVLEAKMTLDGRRAADGDTIAAGTGMETDETGVGAFSLADKLDCQLQHASRATALGGSKLLELKQGSIICDSGLGSEKELEVDGGEAEVVFRDPIFGLQRDAAELQTRVFRGFVEIQPGRAKKWQGRLIGPNENAIVSKGHDPERQPFSSERLNKRDKDAVAAFGAKYPPAEFGFPAPAGSSALERVSSSRRLRYVIDPAAGPQSQAFVADLINFLAQSWGIGAERTARPLDNALERLRAGRIDLLVSPGKAPDSRTFPLFGDEGEKVWLLSVNGADVRFQDAVRNFLTSALELGEYGKRYLAAFGHLPNYEWVRPLIYPDPTPDPSPYPHVTVTPSERPTDVFQVSKVSLQADPAEHSGACPKQITFSGAISATGRGTVRYRFIRSDGVAEPEKSLVFRRAGSQEIQNAWELGGPGLSYSGWQAVEIVGPNQQFRSEEARFSVTCSDVFRVTKASLQANPDSYTGVCPKTFTFAGEITAAGGRGTVRYRFLRSDGEGDTSVRTLTFTGPGSQAVGTTWTLGGSGATLSGWQAIEVLEPAPRLESNRANFTLNCSQAPLQTPSPEEPPPDLQGPR